jgi:hypothetical protein
VPAIDFSGRTRVYGPKPVVLASPPMSTVQLVHSGTAAPAAAHASTDARSSRAPAALGTALLLLILYSAFSHGAVALAADARLQVAVAGVAAIAGGAWLWSGTLRFSAPRLAYAGLGLLAAFAAWSGVSVLWSVAADQTWIELNRVLAYVIVLCLALVLGASHERAAPLMAKGFLLVALVLTGYGLGQKLVPGLHITGVFDLNQTGLLPRLQEPFGYWNALALFIAMGAPIALALAVDSLRSRRTRLLAAVALELMLLAVAFTYSRGGVLALVLALAVGVGLSGARLRSLMWLVTVALTTVAPLVFGLTNHSLSAAGVGLGSREAAGGVLAGVLVVSLLVLVAGVGRLFALEQGVYVGPERARGIARLLITCAGVVLAAGVLAVAFSARGLDGTVSHAWKTFTATQGTSVYEPNRLLSADSQNRWVWWKEAAGAFSDRPVAGWGAGSFPVVHLLYRRDTLSVNQPHSVPLQWLAETGAVGALLGILGWVLLLAAGIRGVRRRPIGPERLLAGAMLAGAAAYAIHALYDWDWDIPGVTLPALVLLGVLVGSSSNRQSDPGRAPPGPGVRALLLGALALCLCTFAVSATLPSLAASKSSAAVLTGRTVTGRSATSGQRRCACQQPRSPFRRGTSSAGDDRAAPRTTRACTLVSAGGDTPGSERRAGMGRAGVRRDPARRCPRRETCGRECGHARPARSAHRPVRGRHFAVGDCARRVAGRFGDR